MVIDKEEQADDGNLVEGKNIGVEAEYKKSMMRLQKKLMLRYRRKGNLN